MGGDRNKVHVIRERKVDDWDEMTKEQVANRLVEQIAEQLEAVHG